MCCEGEIQAVFACFIESSTSGFDGMVGSRKEVRQNFILGA
jgi:hypothetical protein